MSDTPKKNGKGNGKPGASRGNSSGNGRNGKGQFQKGNKEGNQWPPGQSGNPAGRKSLGSLLGEALRREMVDESGKIRMETIAVLAQKTVNWAVESNPDKAYVQRQLLALKTVYDRFDPVALKIEHEHSGQVAVGLTPAATAFQTACGAFAHEHDRRPTIKELREIRNRLQVTDADLGINGHGS